MHLADLAHANAVGHKTTPCFVTSFYFQRSSQLSALFCRAESYFSAFAGMKQYFIYNIKCYEVRLLSLGCALVAAYFRLMGI